MSRRERWEEPGRQAALVIAAYSMGTDEGRESGREDAKREHHLFKCEHAKRAEEAERRRWVESLGYESPEATWVAVNKSRAEERTEALTDALDAVTMACANDDTRAVALAAIKALPGAPA